MKSQIEIQRYIDILSQHPILHTTNPLDQLLIIDLVDLASTTAAITVLKWCLADSCNPADPGPLYESIYALSDEANLILPDPRNTLWRRLAKSPPHAAPCG